MGQETRYPGKDQHIWKLQEQAVLVLSCLENACIPLCSQLMHPKRTDTDPLLSAVAWSVEAFRA